MVSVADFPRLNQVKRGSVEWFDNMVRDDGDIRTEIVQLTPMLAKVLLGRNDGNRCVRKSKVAQYKSDILAGRWSMNGEPIIVSRDGLLNDGQHRCLAVIEANAPIQVIIVFGVERETRETVDQGGARSASDIALMHHVPNAALASAIARMMIVYERNEGRSFANASYLSTAEILDRCINDKKIHDAARFATTNSNYCRNFLVGSVLGAAYYVLSQANPIEAEVFLTQIARGEGLRLKDPAHTLRESLASRGRVGRETKMKLILQAWNFQRRKMKVAPSGMNGTLPFPAVL